MAASHLTTPVWHVGVAVAIAVAAAVAGHDGGARAEPDDRGSPTHHGDAGGETYRGYRLDLSALGDGADAGRLRKAIEHQVDLVEATGLDASTKAFLRRFPVVVQTGASAGSHYDGGDSVAIAVADPGDDRPILLHEYMHVYHVRMLAGGNRNPDILTFYERAREGGFYPAGAYLLKNPGEFFAMTASVYLHGRLAREPFTREELRRKQPVYFGYLNRLFGAPRAAAAVTSRLSATETLQTSGTARP
ncbi:hypothetical protein [Methylobacterium sp. J-077]|uniref:hypothetical protein n=1 Tax=Methylobacterium sp. J-077 TaxID=2836656 RepID=UPI001FBC0F13|nr:hypothetical protein [Methylobacterium sp. J-077]MCJ2126355.1 hypothetical protein [Methylobacterium sp. J-077]